jgi:two-component system OmpR family response regulator
MCSGDGRAEEVSRKSGADAPPHPPGGVGVSDAPLVLVVDDDPHIRDMMRFALERAGFRVAEAADGRAALHAFEETRPDAVILDIMMPEMDGTDVCRVLRAAPPGTGDTVADAYVPIIFVSSRDEEIDRVVGLEVGGDDYLGKPFSPRELVARVRAILRRSAALAATAARGAPGVTAPLRCGRLRLDLDGWRAFWDDQEVVLTATEFGILRTMARQPGKVFSRGDLMDGAYAEANVVSDRTIDSHVRRVRQKFAAVGGDPIETVHGVGYQVKKP